MNKVMLMGRLTKDPENRNTQNSSMTIATFTLAVNKKRRDASGNYVDDADFIPIVAFSNLANICLNNLNKGRQVAIVGKISVSTWGEGTEKRWKTEVIADEVHFVGSKKDYEQEQSQQRSNNQVTNTESQPDNNFGISDDGEDDLPF